MLINSTNSVYFVNSDNIGWIHVEYMWYTCRIHVVYIPDTCWMHVEHTLNEYMLRIDIKKEESISVKTFIQQILKIILFILLIDFSVTVEPYKLDKKEVSLLVDR